MLAQERLQPSIYRQVATDLEQGKLPEAEQLLRAEIKNHPKDAQALGLLAVALDSEKRYAEASQFYSQALALEPGSSSLLNNLGNHYLAQGHTDLARRVYLRVVKLDPHHPNANLQLAAMSLGAKEGKAALHYLAQLPPEAASQPDCQLLRARVLYSSGQELVAEAALHRIEQEAGADPRIVFSAGMIWVEWKQYGEAERDLTKALAADPANFDILYNLGLAAYHAKDYPRAREVLSLAERERPDDPDTLFHLAQVDSAQGDDASAIVLLVRARKVAPSRPDILLLVARLSENLGFFGDAARAFDDYAKLVPKDDVARRERGFALARTSDYDAGLKDLRWFVEKHPRDPRALYELGVAETVHDREKALAHLGQALALDPKMTEARYARAVLDYQGGNTADSLNDLNQLVQQQPANSRFLDLQGEVYLQSDKPAQAAAVLTRAAGLAPDNRKILMHYARALERAREPKQAAAVLAQLQKLPPVRVQPNRGLLDYLGLPRPAQRARYLENLEQAIRMNPNDATLQARLGEDLLSEGKTVDAVAAFNRAAAVTSDSAILERCGEALLSAGQDAAAGAVFEKILQAEPADGRARLNLAIGLFHSQGPEKAQAALDEMPASQRDGDYFLLRAQILDAMGRTSEAVADLNQAMTAAPTRADLNFSAALFLIKHNQLGEAIQFLKGAVERVPDSPQLLLAEAMAYGLARQFETSNKLLNGIENRWPEWGEPYLIQGIVLVGQAKMPEAKPLLQTAIALGVRDSLGYYNLALADMEAFPSDVTGANQAIQQALRLDPRDPYTQSLAGKIDYALKDYPSALTHLTEAIRLWPDMVEAHQALSGTYRALGKKEESVAELKEVLRLKQRLGGASQDQPSPMRSLLFSVPSPVPPIR